MLYLYTMEFYSVVKNNEMPFAATWMDLGIVRLSEATQTKTNMILFICGTQKIVQMNLFTKQK